MRDKPFSEDPCDTVDIIIPIKGLLHPDVSIRILREWCLPLKINNEDGDLIAMAQSVQTKINTHTYINLSCVREEHEANNKVIRSTRSEAVRYQIWLYWRHKCGFTRKMIMMARMGIIFWQNEEEWYTEWSDLPVHHASLLNISKSGSSTSNRADHPSVSVEKKNDHLVVD